MPKTNPITSQIVDQTLFRFGVYLAIRKISQLLCHLSDGSGLFLTMVMTFLVRECYRSPKISIKFVKIRQNSLKFTPEECYDKVLNEEF
jgi:hypothetical protein